MSSQRKIDEMIHSIARTRALRGTIEQVNDILGPPNQILADFAGMDEKMGVKIEETFDEESNYNKEVSIKVERDESIENEELSSLRSESEAISNLIRTSANSFHTIKVPVIEPSVLFNLNRNKKIRVIGSIPKYNARPHPPALFNSNFNFAAFKATFIQNIANLPDIGCNLDCVLCDTNFNVTKIERSLNAPLCNCGCPLCFNSIDSYAVSYDRMRLIQFNVSYIKQFLIKTGYGKKRIENCKNVFELRSFAYSLSFMVTLDQSDKDLIEIIPDNEHVPEYFNVLKQSGVSIEMSICDLEEINDDDFEPDASRMLRKKTKKQ